MNLFEWLHLKLFGVTTDRGKHLINCERHGVTEGVLGAYGSRVLCKKCLENAR